MHSALPTPDLVENPLSYISDTGGKIPGKVFIFTSGSKKTPSLCKPLPDVCDLLDGHLLQPAQPPPGLTFLRSRLKTRQEARLGSATLSGPDVSCAPLFQEQPPLGVRAGDDHVDAVHGAVHHHLQLEDGSRDLT